MVVSLDSKPRRVRLWYQAHIYRMYHFRTLVEREKDSTTPRAKHLQKKIVQHINYGLTLKIPEDEIMRFQADIIKEVKQGIKLGKDAKAIIEILLEKNGQHQ